MKDDLIILALMMITVPLTGELKFFPFHDTYRVSFGTATFFFFLLWMRKKVPLITSGFLVGISVILFRIILDWSVLGNFRLESDFILHFSSFFYYCTYSCLFYFAKVNSFHHRPFIIGLLSIFIEITSGIVELSVRHYLLGNIITLPILSKIIVIAIIRSFFALGFFSIINLHKVKLETQQQQQQNKHMLLLISNLYEESVQIKKSLQDAENITTECYNLYRNLQDSKFDLKTDHLSQKILGIAGQVHEIKKDNQRIYAGLTKMISSENSTDYMNISEISSIIIESNKKYAYLLNKDIQFILNVEGLYPPLHVYTILSIINNLVSNSVESISTSGLIKISIHRIEDSIQFEVTDTGIGVPPKKRELIFKPGYTTKYDIHGKPSTGMGLPYVKKVVTNLNGTVTMKDEIETNETVFVIELPIKNLVKKG